jgi:hypothetical protein
MLTNLRTKSLYKPLIWFGVVLCFISLLWVGMWLAMNNKYALGPDFVEYWAAGRLNIAQGNPYAPDQMQNLQIQEGVIEEGVIMMWNPPWMLVIAMPFGAIEYPLSQALWFILNTIIIFICFTQVWDIYGGMKNYRWLAWVIGFTFIPILDSLKKGQTGALLLLGVVGFLVFIKRRNYWLAGIFLSLLAIKPQILYLLLIAVLFWSIHQKQLKIILGFLAALGLALTISWLINPAVVQQYIFAIQNYPPVDWATPTIGGLLRLLLGVEKFWLQFIPPLLGFIWLIYYWIRNRNSWDWLERTPLLILVSILTAAYAWSWDQTVSIIAILQISVLLLTKRRDLTATLIIVSYLLIDMMILIFRSNEFWKIWLAPILLIFYLTSLNILKPRKDSLEI